MTVKYLQTKPTTITYGISDSSTTIQLKNLLKLDGTSVSSSDIGDLLYGTFAPNTSREEIFSIVGSNVTVESNGNITITNVTRGLKEVSPYDTGGYKCDHPTSEVVVFGNNPQVYQALKDYIDQAVISGGIPATDTVPGISTRATPTQINDGTEDESYNAINYPLFVNPKDLSESKYKSALQLVGIVSPYAGTSTPTGWLLCDGAAVSRTTYADLYAVIGTTYGVGDNSTTFNLPNLKNRIPIGLDSTVKIVLDNCDAAWTAGANVTATNDTVDKKEGTGSVKLDIGVSASAGQILGYKAISSVSLAGKTTVGMWIKSSIDLVAGDLKYQMDDSVAIASPLESIDIPALIAGVWTKIYLTLANPGSDTAIVSHGIYQVNDKGAFQLWIDDINEGENYEVGATGGEKTHKLLTSELAAHNHTLQYRDGNTGGTTQTNFTVNNGYYNLGYTTYNDNSAHITNTGGDLPHNNLQPYITLNYIIKY